MDKQLIEQYAIGFFKAGCWLLLVALVIIAADLRAHASESPRLTPQQVAAREAISKDCSKGEPYTYSACMVRAIAQSQRLGFYLLTAPVPVVDLIMA